MSTWLRSAVFLDTFSMDPFRENQTVKLGMLSQSHPVTLEGEPSSSSTAPLPQDLVTFEILKVCY